MAASKHQVHGNRHVGGCCGGKKHEKPHPFENRSKSPPLSKRRKSGNRSNIVISPSRRFAETNQERDEEFRNYKQLVE